MANSILAKMAVLISANTAAFDKSLAHSQNSLAKFTGALKTVGGVMGAVFAGTSILQGLKYGLGIMSDFESTMSEVKAITGATGKEFDSLEKDALKLGASTKFTSQQVGELQVAYGRLGFTTKEILKATKATLDLAAATGEDLAKSADVAGSTVRGFGLDAKETQRVVDVMASSFNKSALGLENFTESMKYVAPVAHAAGISVEETTALLATLADAGIRGSMAGTSLRKILTDLPKDGRPFQERLDELAKKGITVADAMDEVGRTAQTSLLILANNTEKTNQLAAAFQNVEGEAAKMARTMADNLTGDVEKLTSAWEGLILKIGDSSWWRKKTQELTSFINALSGTTDVDTGILNLAQAIKETTNDGVIDEFIEKLKSVRREAGEPIDINIAQELAEKFKLTDQQANKLYSSLLEVNKALSFQENAIKQFNEFAERNGYADLSQAASDYKQRLYELILAEQIQQQQLQKFVDAGGDMAKAFQPAINKSKEQVDAYRRIINILAEYAKTLDATAKKQEDLIADEIISIDYLQEKLKQVNAEFEGGAITDTKRLQLLAAESVWLDTKIKKLLQIKELEASGAALGDTKKVNADLVDTDKMITKIYERLRTLKTGIKTETAEIKKEFIDLGSAISSGIADIASSLGQALGEGKKFEFGQAILKAVGKFAQQLGAIMISIGVGEQLLQSGNPYAMIIGGAALVAAGAALSALMDQKQNLVTSAANGASSNSSTTRNSSTGTMTGNEMEIRVGGEWVIRGNDLVYIFNRTNQLNGRTRNG